MLECIKNYGMTFVAGESYEINYVMRCYGISVSGNNSSMFFDGYNNISEYFNITKDKYVSIVRQSPSEDMPYRII